MTTEWEGPDSDRTQSDVVCKMNTSVGKCPLYSPSNKNKVKGMDFSVSSCGKQESLTKASVIAGVRRQCQDAAGGHMCGASLGGASLEAGVCFGSPKSEIHTGSPFHRCHF